MPGFASQPASAALSDEIIRYWTAFATYADPNARTESSDGRRNASAARLYWPPVSAEGALRQIVLNATRFHVEAGWEAHHCKVVEAALSQRFPMRPSRRRAAEQGHHDSGGEAAAARQSVLVEA